MTDIRTGNCPLCAHDEIIESELRYVGPDALQPLSVAQEPPAWGHSPAWGPFWRPVGVFHAYVCRKCGFTQFFASGIEKLQIDESVGTRLIKGAAVDRGPYR